MNPDYVFAAFRHFIAGDQASGIEAVELIAASEKVAGRSIVASRLRSLCATRKLTKLPDAPPEVRLSPATKRLADLELPETVRADVEKLIAEYKHADKLRAHGLQPRTTILLYGPSGNGKTALVSAIANALSLPLAIVNYGETIDSHLGETGKNLAKVMKFARSRPCVLLFDEADSLLSARGGDKIKEIDRCVNHLLIELDDRPRNAIFAFASNFDEALDSAFRRRVEIDIELPAPTEDVRRQFMQKTARRFPFLGDSLANIEVRPSFAECEQAVEDAARDHLLKPAPKRTAKREVSHA